MKNTLITLSAIALLGAITGCKKEESASPDPSPMSNGSPFHAFFAQNIADATQQFAVNAGTGGQVEGSQGTRLFFPPNAFVDQDGLPVTGSVQVGLVEVLTVGDMIWLNKQTLGDDNGSLCILSSGGELLVTASQGSNVLDVVENGLIVSVPAAIGDPAMGVFLGTEDPEGNMIWRPDTAELSFTFDSSSVEGGFYEFNVDSLTWINCDHFMGFPNTSHVHATLPAGQPGDSTIFWIVLPSENAVMHMPLTSLDFFTTWQEVPVGMDAVLVGLYRNGSSYYSSFNPITVATDLSVQTIFSSTTTAEFEIDLDGL